MQKGENKRKKRETETETEKGTYKSEWRMLKDLLGGVAEKGEKKKKRDDEEEKVTHVDGRSADELSGNITAEMPMERVSAHFAHRSQPHQLNRVHLCARGGRNECGKVHGFGFL